MINPKYALRPYQWEARNAVLSDWESGIKKSLIVLPTGTGKTVVFTSIIDHEIRDSSKALVLAHRDILIDQAIDKLRDTHSIEVNRLDKTHRNFNSDAPVTVSSVQSMSKSSVLNKYPNDYFKTIVIDEAHHILSNTYQKIMNYFSDANILGVTATPDRGDRRDLGTFFDNLSYEYLLSDAIKDGYIPPIITQQIKLEIDIRELRILGSDFKDSDIDNVLTPYFKKISDKIKNICNTRRTVIFLPLIKTCEKFVKILNENGISAAAVNGKTKSTNDEILDKFRKGEIQVICNSMLLTEGWDEPSVDCIIVLRPTVERNFYAQMVGRGLRPSPETGKKNLLLLDFLWLSNTFNLCKPSSLVSKDEMIAGFVDDMLKDSRKPKNLIGLVKMAEDKVVHNRELDLARRLAGIKKMNLKLLHPLQYAISTGNEDLLNYRPYFAWEKENPTEKQIALLEKFGIFGEVIRNAGAASQVIKIVLDRQKRKLSSPRQIRVLEKRGFTHVGQWLFIDASEMLDILRKNKWQVPKEINPETYIPPERPKVKYSKKEELPTQLKLW